LASGSDVSFGYRIVGRLGERRRDDRRREIDTEEVAIVRRSFKTTSHVDRPEQIAKAGRPMWDKPDPNKSKFTNVDGKVCGFGGEGDEVAQNQRKNRTDLPTSYHDVTFDALASLPYPMPAPKLRSDWTADRLILALAWLFD
jgi:hypothetical protein